ncbi:hypothetical protein PROFUN_02133 [Planoprotostelium fungivorum]|uniref:Uncharacterized protein n=1 Tax=Planoprotostelium fungivorum TaxID=1890364 RepID=A0A2P6NZA7_9EUKA|nr:hypothetical protein PROFUN_02133 [Planoprotostelium fungivorum]
MDYQVLTLTFQSVYNLFLTLLQVSPDRLKGGGLLFGGPQFFAVNLTCSICSYQFSRLIALEHSTNASPVDPAGTPGSIFSAF